MGGLLCEIYLLRSLWKHYIGYKVPISQKIAKNLRVYVDVNNPFVITNWTGLDPETDNGTYAYPNVTSYNFGVSISF